MGCFLERIDGQTSEDLTSEMLGFFLTSRDYSPYQRLFYSLIFPDHELKDSEERLFDIATQMSIGNKGIPDIVIEGEQTVILIENKFYASFSQNDQMYRYFKLINKQYMGKEKYLILLTIKDRIDFYLKEIRKQFEPVFTTDSNEELFNYCSENGVKLQTLSWEDIFKVFGAKDFLIADLNDYIQRKYITSTILNEREIEMINSKEVPILMEKLWAGIDKIKDTLAGEGYDVTRTSQSKLTYGFGVERYWGQVWVYLNLESWKEFGRPYSLKIFNDLINDKYKKADYASELKSVGFSLDNNKDHICPILLDVKDTEEKDIVGSTKGIIVDKINQLDQMFESLLTY